MSTHDRAAPVLFTFEGFEHRRNSTCLVMSEQIPGFVLVGNDWDEIEAKIEQAAKEFLEFDGYKVDSFELMKTTRRMPDFRPTSFRASFSGSKIAA